MTATPSDELGRFVWTVVLLLTAGLLGWWLLLAASHPHKPRSEPLPQLTWLAPEDFLGDAIVSDATDRLVEKVKPPAVPTPSEENAPDASDPAFPPADTPSVTGPMVRVVKFIPASEVGPEQQSSLPPELAAFDWEVQHTLLEIWTPPRMTDIPPGSYRMIVKLTFARDGSVMKNEEFESSGHALMDRSVRYATALFINAGRPVPDAHEADAYVVIVDFWLR